MGQAQQDRGRVAMTIEAARASVERLSVRAVPLAGAPDAALARPLSTQALAHLVAGHARLGSLPDGDAHAARALLLASALVERATPVGGGLGWGYDADVDTPFGRFAGGRPNALATAHAAHALLDAATLARRPDLAEAPRLALAWACADLLVEHRGERLFVPTPESSRPIHSVNLLLASLAARCADWASDAWRAGEDAYAYSLARQRSDGSWPCGETHELRAVDAVHLARILESLAVWEERTGDADVAVALTAATAALLARLGPLEREPRRPVEESRRLAIVAAGLAAAAHVDDRALPTAGRLLDRALASGERRAVRALRARREAPAGSRMDDGIALVALAGYLTAIGRTSAEPAADVG
ncbi:MAG: hypothetical protein R3C15_14740 [Thermoleophilia bacterium]